jgi:hypothetical protein
VSGRVVMVIRLFLAAEHHPMIPRAALEAVNGVRGRAHSGGDGGRGQGLRPGGRRGIRGRPCSAGSIERGGLRRARRVRRVGFWFVLASGAFAQREPVGWGQVQGSAKVTIFLLQLCDAMLEGLYQEGRAFAVVRRG